MSTLVPLKDDYSWCVRFEDGTIHDSTLHGPWSTFSELTSLAGIEVYQSTRPISMLSIEYQGLPSLVFSTPPNTPLPMFAIKQYTASLFVQGESAWVNTVFGYEFHDLYIVCILTPHGAWMDTQYACNSSGTERYPLSLGYNAHLMA